MELFFLAVLFVLMIYALGSGYPVAFALPGSSVTELKVTEDLVSKPEEELRRLLAV